jgi:ABC-type nitrate/sulfonate/bicarbonate transport system permease component
MFIIPLPVYEDTADRIVSFIKQSVATIGIFIVISILGFVVGMLIGTLLGLLVTNSIGVFTLIIIVSGVIGTVIAWLVVAIETRIIKFSYKKYKSPVESFKPGW